MKFFSLEKKYKEEVYYQLMILLTTVVWRQ